MSGERTIKIKFDGEQSGLVKAANGSSTAINKLDNGVKKNTQSLGAHTKAAQKSAEQSERMRTGFLGAGSAAGLAAVGIGVAVGAWISETGRAMANVERLKAQTDTVVRSMGAAWTDTDHIVNYANKLEALSGIEMEQVQAGQNLLLTYGNIQNRMGAGNDIFDQATSLMLDLSVATGKDMSGAATLLGKALNDPISGLGALTKVGVQFTDQQKQQITAMVQAGDVMGAQKIILAELTRQFGGSAKAFGETTAGQVLKLQNEFGNLSEELLVSLLPTVNAVVDAFVGVVHWLQENENLVKTVGVALAGMAATWLLVKGAIALVNATTAAWNAVASLASGSTAGLGASFAAMGTAAKVASLSMGAIGIIATIIGTALSIFGGQSAEAEAQQQALASASKDVAKVLEEENNQLNKKTRAAAAAALEQGGLLQSTKALGLSTKDLADAYLGDNDARIRLNRSIQDHIDALNREEDAALAAGDGNRAAEIEREIEAYGEQKTAIDNAIGTRQGESEAIDRQAEATEGSTESTQNSTSAIQDNIDALLAHIDAVREAAGIVLDQREAERQWTESLAAADEALVNNKMNIDNNTEAGRDNNEKLDNLAKSTLDLIGSLAANGASHDELTSKMFNARGEFIRLATQMGYSQAQAVELANKLGLVPGTYTAVVDANTGPATGKLGSFSQLLNSIFGRTYTVAINALTQVADVVAGHRATGGPVMAGKPYKVGERGVEIWVPPNSGNIIPNHQLGGGGDTVVYVSIDGQQLQGRIDRTVRENNRGLKRAASAGAGGAR